MPSLKERVLAQYEQATRQYHDQDALVRTFAKVTPEYVFQLLDEARPFVRETAKRLVMRMATRKWQIKAAPHEGGHAENAALHITLGVDGKGWHLYCKELAGHRLYVFTITEPR